MDLTTLIDLVDATFDARVLVEDPTLALTGGDLAQRARTAAPRLGDVGAVVYVGENQSLVAVALLAAASAGRPFIPLNYRLDDDRLHAAIEQQPDPLVLTDGHTAARLEARTGCAVLADWLAEDHTSGDAPEPPPSDAVAIILQTSGTTAEPKGAVLRHRHLMSYLLGAVEFAGASEDEAAVVSVPPYHIAGMANLLSNLFAGRRVVYVSSFDAETWLGTVRRSGATHAMVVPTMLARIVEHLDGAPADTPTLRTLAYGGAKMSERVLLEALRTFPGTGFVNAYGLTETASTIAVLGPDDHRTAASTTDPRLRRRLRSAGRVLPTVEVEIRDESGAPMAPGETGLIHVRGEQVAGEYATGSLLDRDGWFCTRDRGSIDDEGYLFVDGRADDTIIRGGENIAPAEIEAVLLTHEAVSDACVVGVPDDEWGQRIAAAVVVRPGATPAPEDLIDHVRSALRGSKTPDDVLVVDALPVTDTGKVIRRAVVERVVAARGATADQPT